MHIPGRIRPSVVYYYSKLVLFQRAQIMISNLQQIVVAIKILVALQL